jgi:hypothetical protein
MKYGGLKVFHISCLRLKQLMLLLERNEEERRQTKLANLISKKAESIKLSAISQ